MANTISALTFDARLSEYSARASIHRRHVMEPLVILMVW